MGHWGHALEGYTESQCDPLSEVSCSALPPSWQDGQTLQKQVFLSEAVLEGTGKILQWAKAPAAKPDDLI